MWLGWSSRPAGASSPCRLGFLLCFDLVAGLAEALYLVGVVRFGSVDAERLDVDDVVELINAAGANGGRVGGALVVLPFAYFAFHCCGDAASWSAVRPCHQSWTVWLVQVARVPWRHALRGSVRGAPSGWWKRVGSSRWLVRLGQV